MEKTICIVCAWRETCQKRFRMREGIELRCPDFVRDVSIKEDKEDVKEGDKEKAN